VKIIFLDIDGVLNNSKFLRQNPGAKAGTGQQLDPRAIALLDRLVAATGAKIVISSTWRHSSSPGQIDQMLKDHGFQHTDSILDRTPVGENNRGQEVQEWLQLDVERIYINPKHEPVQDYVILDDTDEFLPEQRPHFVHVNPQTGLTQRDVEEAIAILRMR
jgi:HAD domain in Swiss Army Knife RNA repair proteins